MPPLTLLVNGKKHTLDVDPDTPLLWVLRDILGLTGTKFGCGIAQCGVCTVLRDGAAVKSCVTPVSAVDGKPVVTIEGLPTVRKRALQQAWIAHEVPQCGYCQVGMMLTASGLLAEKPNPTEAEIDEALMHNICRCGTYLRIRKAVQTAAKNLKAKPTPTKSAPPKAGGTRGKGGRR